MIAALLLTALSSCPTFTVVNKTKEWNDNDNQSLTYVIETGCKIRYENSPCLKTFTKTEHNTYNILCTSKKEGK